MRKLRFAALAFVLVLGGCADQSSPTSARFEPLAVATTNYPLQYFAQRVGADLVDVICPVPPDTDPASWQPDAEAYSRMSAADLVVVNGAGSEPWLDGASLPKNLIVDASAAFTYRLIAAGSQNASSGDISGEPATTVWLDPMLAVRQGHAIADALMSRLPGHRREIHHRMEGMKSEFLNLDDRFGVAAGTISDEPLLFSRPVYQYLVRRYGLNALMLDIAPDEPFDAQDRAMLEEVLETHPARWILWDEEPIPNVVAALDRLGVQSRVFDPCRKEPASGDFMTVMAANAGSLETIAESVRAR
jgi:zinc transport system substrate-binding protein